MCAEEQPQPPRSEIDLSDYLQQRQPSSQSWRAVKYYRQNTTPPVIRWAMKLSGGLIKDEQRAAYAVLAFVVIAVVAAAFFFLQLRAPAALERLIPVR